MVRSSKMKIRMRKLISKRWIGSESSSIMESSLNSNTPEPSYSVNNYEKDSSEAGCSYIDSSLQADHREDIDINIRHVNKPFYPSGRRIIDVEYWFKSILNHKHNDLFNCSFTDMEIIKEVKKGYLSLFQMKCKMCQSELHLHSEDPLTENLDVNMAAVSAVVLTGGGCSQLQEMSAVLNMPTLSNDLFYKCQAKLNEVLEENAWSSMKQAGEEEYRLAVERGDIDKEGVPYITVIADGAWSKRSYRVNYNALSGVACIVGQATGKILFIGIRNRYCCICDRSRVLSLDLPTHKCFKNWDGTATSMESDIIVEGFRCSLEMHGLIYSKLVGDGDSSVHRKILETRPYDYQLIVEKIECANHLLRNYCNNLRELSTKRYSSNGTFVPVNLRHLLTNNIRRLRCAIEYAAKYRRQECDAGYENLKNDILNSVNHVFGKHEKCAEYFCKRSKNKEMNYVPQFMQCGLYNDIMSHINRLVYNVKGLFLNMTNNSAERYNSVVAKFTGGKRINFSTRNSYQGRCFAAALSYNSRGRLHYVVHKAVTNKSPSKMTKKFISNKQRKTERKKTSSIKKCRRVALFSTDKDYGPRASQESMSLEKYNLEKNKFLANLHKDCDAICELERKTIDQSHSQLWHTERLQRITASNFGRICKLRTSTSCASTIKSILYSTFQGNMSTKYGIEKEPIAIQSFEDKFHLKVTKCGLFIDTEDCYLAASPDGLIGTDTIIEVKCPANSSTMPPEDAIMQKKVMFANLCDNEFTLKRQHVYYYQVQGQLHVTKRLYCYFVFWTPLGMLVEKITRDDDFWSSKMSNLLKLFYFDCLLPEIIDPQLPKNLPIKNPEYRRKI